MDRRRLRGALVELAIGAALLVLGIFVSVVAAGMPATGGFSGVGPAAMPKIVATGLIVVSLWLLAESLTGGWRQRESDDPTVRGEHAFFAPGFVWISAGLIGQMALIHTAGFVIAAAVLFVCVSRGFGSRRLLRDAGIGALLSLGIFSFFVKFLNVNLPAGWLKPLLGAAGI